MNWLVLIQLLCCSFFWKDFLYEEAGIPYHMEYGPYACQKLAPIKDAAELCNKIPNLQLNTTQSINFIHSLASLDESG